MAYNIAYPDIPNMGDLLNKYMLEDVFNISVNRTSLKNCNLIAIGSTLDHIVYYPKLKDKLKQKISNMFNDNVHIWGTGFIRGNAKLDSSLIYKNIYVHALRGNLTKSRMERLLGKKLDVPLGDGGLLAQKWLGYYPEKKYSVGIVPHFKEQTNTNVDRLLKSYENSVFIDLKDTPIDVVKKIGECELIISSSLHGMIVADSFHIPNIHITLTNSMFGDGNKYNDYMSAYNIQHTPFDCSDGSVPDIKTIKDNYKIDSDIVEQKKQQLFECFPKL